MKKLLLIPFFFLLTNCFSQKLTKVTLADNSNVESLTFELEQGLLLNISKDGHIIEYGVDTYIGPGENYWNRLQKYEGRVELYGPGDNEAFRGKVKYIGRSNITYYASYENDILKGRIKSIGSNMFDYYAAYDDVAIRGNIKTIGMTAFSWYSSTDNEAYKGKLRSAGLTNLSYYSSFDDKAFKGRIKNIDRTNFTYYSSMDRREYQGGMKTGTSMVYANNIKYFIKN